MPSLTGTAEKLGEHLGLLDEPVLLVDLVHTGQDVERVVTDLIGLRRPPGARLADEIGLLGVPQPAGKGTLEPLAFQSRLQAQEGVVGLSGSGLTPKSGISFSMYPPCWHRA